MVGGISGGAHFHGVADEARRSTPAQCMGLHACEQHTGVCVRRAAKGAQGNLARRETARGGSKK